MAGAGESIFFVLCLAGFSIVALYTFSFAARCVFTIVVGTAAGDEELQWPDEPMVDWIWQAVYMAWLIGVWLAPALLIAGAITAKSPHAGQAITIVTAILFWIIFPICVLSSMSASSRWAVLSPVILPPLTRRFGSLMIFYFLTGPIIIAAAFGVHLLVRTQGPWAVLAGAAILSFCVLCYARFIGRLAQLVRLTSESAADDLDEVRATPKSKQPARRVVARARRATAPRVQPRDLPGIQTPFEGEVHGYDVRYDDLPAASDAAPPRTRRPIDLDDEPYDVMPPVEDPPEGRVPKRVMVPSKLEMNLAERGRSLDLPENPWLGGTLAFPFRLDNLSPLIWLVVWIMASGILLRMMV